MTKIIAVGGGEIGRPGHPVETTRIDKEIMNLTRRKNPSLLFIPTASSDSESYCKAVEKHFGKKLGCKTDVLFLINKKINFSEIKRKILETDIIYVGGGNTLKMMENWRRNKVDELLKQAYRKGTILSGLSAGAICWFKWGNSDSRRFNNPNANLIKVRGLNLINVLYCPHYHQEKDRKKDLKAMMKNTPGVAVAIDNCAAIEIIDSKYRIISSKRSANAYKVYWKKGKYSEELIKKNKKFRELSDLLKK